MSTGIAQRSAEFQQGFAAEAPPFGCGDEAVTVAPAADAEVEDNGSSEPLQGQEMVDVAHLLDEMEATRQRIVADPRVADAAVKLNATAQRGTGRVATFGVTVWLHDGRYFYGEGPSLADAELDSMLAASVGYVEAAKRKAAAGKAVAANA